MRFNGVCSSPKKKDFSANGSMSCSVTPHKLRCLLLKTLASAHASGTQVRCPFFDTIFTWTVIVGAGSYASSVNEAAIPRTNKSWMGCPFMRMRTWWSRVTYSLKRILAIVLYTRLAKRWTFTSFFVGPLNLHLWQKVPSSDLEASPLVYFTCLLSCTWDADLITQLRWQNYSLAFLTFSLQLHSFYKRL